MGYLPHMDFVGLTYTEDEQGGAAGDEDRSSRVRLRETMSPARFAPLDGTPGVAALARDAEFKLLWCNALYAKLCGRDRPEQMVGTTMDDFMPSEMAEERKALMKPALMEHKVVAYEQLWLGSRQLTRVWALDHDAFGCDGYFVVINKLTDPLDEHAMLTAPVRFVHTGDMGELSTLSDRELEVYYYLAVGMTMGDIANLLFRSEKTIGRHIENIYKKLGYTSRPELVADAVKRGLVEFTSEQWMELIESRVKE